MCRYRVIKFGFAGFVFLSALGFYAGAYCCVVDRFVKAYPDTPYQRGFRYVQVAYQVRHEWEPLAETFFAPIHAVDQEVRPAYWAGE